MRLGRRSQGRIPIKLAPTKWMIMVDGLRWEGDSLSGLHRWLIIIQPAPESKVGIWRNWKQIYDGTWQDLAGDATLW